MLAAARRGRRARDAGRRRRGGVARAGARVPRRATGACTTSASEAPLGYGELTKRAARQPVPEQPRLKPARRVHADRQDRPPRRRAREGRRHRDVRHRRPRARHGARVRRSTVRCSARVPRPGRAPTRRASAPGVIDVLRVPLGRRRGRRRSTGRRSRAARDVEVDVGQGRRRRPRHRGARSGRDARVRRRRHADARRRQRRRARCRRRTTKLDGGLRGAVPRARAARAAELHGRVPAQARRGVGAVPGPTLVQALVAEAIGVDSERRARAHDAIAAAGSGAASSPDFAAQAAMIAKRVEAPGQAHLVARERHDAGLLPPAVVAIKCGGRRRRRQRDRRCALHCISQSITMSSRDDRGRGARRHPAAALKWRWSSTR